MIYAYYHDISLVFSCQVFFSHPIILVFTRDNKKSCPVRVFAQAHLRPDEMDVDSERSPKAVRRVAHERRLAASEKTLGRSSLSIMNPEHHEALVKIRNCHVGGIALRGPSRAGGLKP